MPIWQLCANLLIPNRLRSNLSYSPLAALELYVKWYNTNIIVKDQDTVKESLLKKIDYNGQEYEEFLKAKKEGKFNAADITDDDGSPQDEPDPNYKEPSEDIPTEIPSDVVVDTVPRNR